MALFLWAPTQKGPILWIGPLQINAAALKAPKVKGDLSVTLNFYRGR
jgi:hypothetical protein